MKKNENCLMDMSCPKCKSLEPFAVSAKCMTLMYDDGTEDSWDYEWGQEASCECFKCKHSGTVKDFTTA